MALLQVQMRSNCLNRQVRFNAIIPADSMFAPPGAERKPFKALYLLHGYTGGCSSWFTDTLPVGTYSMLHNLAIIMPDGENHFYVDDEKSGARYSEFIGRELVDFTRRIFPLSHERGDTLIAGISMGGYGALYNGMKYSDVFGHILGISPANIISELPASSPEPNPMGVTRAYYETVFGDLDRVGSTDMELGVCAADMLKSGRPLPDVYFACGWNDMLVYPNRVFHEQLDALGCPHVYEEGPGSHEPAFFNPHFAAGMERVLPAPDMSGFPNPFAVDAEKTSPFYKG